MINVHKTVMPHLMNLPWRRWFYRILLILGISALLLCSDGYLALPSLAEIRQYHNGDGQMLDQSRRSLRDIDRHPWQVVVFQQVSDDGDVGATELRLVGFPEQVVFKHPAPLILRTRTGQDWLAADEFGTFTPAASVGQFDITEIIGQLSVDEPLVLEMPTTPGTILKIPATLVQEWQLFS